MHDPAVIDRIVASINPRPTDRMVEIGPGLGAITTPLISALGRLTAIELDRDLAETLKQRFGATLELHRADALAFDFATLVSADEKLRIVGNLPYNISTPLLFRLLEFSEVVEDMHFMLQREVVARMAAQPNNKTYGRLSVMLGLFCDVEPLFDIGSGAFRPPPKVESAFVRLIPLRDSRYPIGTLSDLRQIVASAFSMRRKTIKNSLAKLLTPEQLDAAGIDPMVRAEALSPKDFARLSQIYADRLA